MFCEALFTEMDHKDNLILSTTYLFWRLSLNEREILQRKHSFFKESIGAILSKLYFIRRLQLWPADTVRSGYHANRSETSLDENPMQSTVVKTALPSPQLTKTCLYYDFTRWHKNQKRRNMTTRWPVQKWHFLSILGFISPAEDNSHLMSYELLTTAAASCTRPPYDPAQQGRHYPSMQGHPKATVNPAFGFSPWVVHKSGASHKCFLFFL
jgi:hypothetical protein